MVYISKQDENGCPLHTKEDRMSRAVRLPCEILREPYDLNGESYVDIRFFWTGRKEQDKFEITNTPVEFVVE